MKNRYIHRAKISERKFRQLLQLFCLDLTASQIAEVTGINRNTVNRYMVGIRCRISEYCCRETAKNCLDSSETFGQDEAVDGDIPISETRIVGVVKKNGKISCRMISEKTAEAFQHLKFSKRDGKGFRIAETNENCVGLIDLRRMKYVKLPTDGNGGDGKAGIDICEGFWGIARGRLQRFRGLRKSTLPLHIRECEFRYNHGQKELYPLLLQIVRERPLFK